VSYFLFIGFFNRYLLQQDSGSGVLTEYIFLYPAPKKINRWWKLPDHPSV